MIELIIKGNINTSVYKELYKEYLFSLFFIKNIQTLGFATSWILFMHEQLVTT